MEIELLKDLWLPILASAAAVWIASAVIWMVLPHHRKDYKSLPDESGFTAFLKVAALPPGMYAFPHCGDRAKSKDPEFEKRWKEGPTGFVSIWPPMNMPRNMILTFLVYLVVSVLIAYLGAAAGIERGAPFAKVLQVLGTAGVLAYCFAFIPNGIWLGQSARALVMNIIDGIIFGLATGAVFAALWPAGSMPGMPVLH